jgi:hypothetical protein
MVSSLTLGKLILIITVIVLIIVSIATLIFITRTDCLEKEDCLTRKSKGLSSNNNYFNEPVTNMTKGEAIAWAWFLS